MYNDLTMTLQHNTHINIIEMRFETVFISNRSRKEKTENDQDKTDTSQAKIKTKI